MSSLAEYHLEANRRSLASISPAERVALALDLGDADLEIFRLAKGLDEKEALAELPAPTPGRSDAVQLFRGVAVTLLAEVAVLLEASGSRYAMIGATALAVLGASRSTQDLDILTPDRTVLRRSFWDDVAARGAECDIRSGDIQDPLVGIVRVTRGSERPIDIIVGEGLWQERILEEAVPREIAGVDVPVVDAVGLVLLKLYAGGPQDRWDIEQVLALAADRTQLEREIDVRLSGLPKRCRRLWDLIADSD